MTVPHTVPGLCRFQAEWCGKLGSPLYEYLLNRCADDYEQPGPLHDLLEPHKDDPRGSALALRLMGAVHRLVLEGRAPELARLYASLDGRSVPAEAWALFLNTLREHRLALQELICLPVQTNEVGRCGALLGGFLLTADRTRLPLRLLEIGSSAGLNLRWDCYRYIWNSGAWGAASSPVVLENVFTGDAAPPLAPVTIVGRRGCDPRPIDPASDEGRLTLLSFIWPEQHQRRRLLERALKVAAAVPCTVDRAHAVDWLKFQLSAPKEAQGRCTVVFHSIVWQYLSHDERRQVTEIIEGAGASATPKSSLAWLRMEPGGDSAEVKLRIFPDFPDQLIAQASFHSPQATWLAGADTT